MPITRKWVAQDTELCQILAVEDYSRFVVVDSCDDWQAVFGPDSSLNDSNRVVKIAAELDYTTFSKIRLAAYLYNTDTSGIDSSGGCDFRIHTVKGPPGWTEQLELVVAGVEQITNHIFFKEVDLSLFDPGLFDGSTTLMIEAFITRLDRIFRERVYVNHVGIYDSFTRLKQEVDYLDLVKLDE